MRTLEWDSNSLSLKLIDQRYLPGRLTYITCKTTGQVEEAIKSMAVRGAPAIGVAAAFGIALSALTFSGSDIFAMQDKVDSAANHILKTRPTAVNLAWAVNKMRLVAKHHNSSISDLQDHLLAEACRMAEEDIATNRRMAEFGASLISNGDTILHHCNTGSLAAVDWGTALGAIRMAHEQGKHPFVLVDETRPRLQGARLTAWELQQYGIPFAIIVDGAAGYFLQRGEVQKVMFGADRVTANGDVINKIGTYMLALSANQNKVPVYSVFPQTTFDPNIETGNQVIIEERNPSEVLDLEFAGERTTPKGVQARNPAFDITPNSLINAHVTDQGIIYPPFIVNKLSILGNVQMENI